MPIHLLCKWVDTPPACFANLKIRKAWPMQQPYMKPYQQSKPATSLPHRSPSGAVKIMVDQFSAGRDGQHIKQVDCCQASFLITTLHGSVQRIQGEKKTLV
jgi:hypothetical protein